MPDTMLVRIKPRNNRDRHVLLVGGKSYPFLKERGWHRVPRDVAAIAAEERMNELNGDSPLVFDVKDPEAAARQVEAETFREDPAGTPEKPHDVRPTDMGQPIEAQAPARRRGRVS